MSSGGEVYNNGTAS